MEMIQKWSSDSQVEVKGTPNRQAGQKMIII